MHMPPSSQFAAKVSKQYVQRHHDPADRFYPRRSFVRFSCRIRCDFTVRKLAWTDYWSLGRAPSRLRNPTQAGNRLFATTTSNMSFKLQSPSVSNASRRLSDFLAQQRKSYLNAVKEGKGREWAVVMGNEAGGMSESSYHMLRALKATLTRRP